MHRVVLWAVPLGLLACSQTAAPSAGDASAEAEAGPPCGPDFKCPDAGTTLDCRPSPTRSPYCAPDCLAVIRAQCPGVLVGF
jgi:hypothetical protein